MLQSEDARRGSCATLVTANLFPRQLRIRHAKWQFLAHVIGSGERPDFPGAVLRSAFKLFSRKLPPSNVKLCFFGLKSSLIRLTRAFAFLRRSVCHREAPRRSLRRLVHLVRLRSVARVTAEPTLTVILRWSFQEGNRGGRAELPTTDPRWRRTSRAAGKGNWTRKMKQKDNDCFIMTEAAGRNRICVQTVPQRHNVTSPQGCSEQCDGGSALLLQKTHLRGGRSSMPSPSRNCFLWLKGRRLR